MNDFAGRDTNWLFMEARVAIERASYSEAHVDDALREVKRAIALLEATRQQFQVWADTINREKAA